MLFLIAMMFAFVCVVSQFIGWQFPLTATATRSFNPKLSIAVVIATEILWLATNAYAVMVLRCNWKTPPGRARGVAAATVSLSFPAQVFLGHLAIRDLRTFLESMPCTP